MDNKELPKPDREYLDVKEHGRQEEVFPDYPLGKNHKGSSDLVEKYNINDKAHSDSSKKDFIDTVSNFHHADEKEEKEDGEFKSQI